MFVNVKKLSPNAMLPTYATSGSACFDLHACFEGADPPVVGKILDCLIAIERGYPEVISTGLAFEIPDGHVMLILSRSGHGFKHNVRLSNCVGVIDSDYRGEIKVKLDSYNVENCLKVKHGDRIAQAMIIPVPHVRLVEVEQLSETIRGLGGFGSTGTGKVDPYAGREGEDPFGSEGKHGWRTAPESNLPPCPCHSIQQCGSHDPKVVTCMEKTLGHK